MNAPSSLPPPDTPEESMSPEVMADPRKNFLEHTKLTEEQEAVFHRLWDIIADQGDGSSLEEIHGESAAA